MPDGTLEQQIIWCCLQGLSQNSECPDLLYTLGTTLLTTQTRLADHELPAGILGDNHQEQALYCLTKSVQTKPDEDAYIRIVQLLKSLNITIPEAMKPEGMPNGSVDEQIIWCIKETLKLYGQYQDAFRELGQYIESRQQLLPEQDRLRAMPTKHYIDQAHFCYMQVLACHELSSCEDFSNVARTLSLRKKKLHKTQLWDGMPEDNWAAQAVFYYRKALELKPDDETSLLGLATLLSEHSIPITEDVDKSYFAGLWRVLNQSSQFMQAERVANNAASSSGHEDADLWFDSAKDFILGTNVHRNDGQPVSDEFRHQQAAACLRKALALQPDHTRSFKTLANLIKMRHVPINDDLGKNYFQSLWAWLCPDPQLILDAHANSGVAISESDAAVSNTPPPTTTPSMVEGNRYLGSGPASAVSSGRSPAQTGEKRPAERGPDGTPSPKRKH